MKDHLGFFLEIHKRDGVYVSNLMDIIMNERLFSLTGGVFVDLYRRAVGWGHLQRLHPFHDVTDQTRPQTCLLQQT